MIEVHSIDKGAIAIPYRKRRRLKSVRILDGMDLEEPTPNEVSTHSPRSFPAFVEVARKDGSEVKRRHWDLFEAADTISYGFAGLAILPSGDLAAIYRAQLQRLNEPGSKN